MLQIGVQTRNVVYDECPEQGFQQMKAAGFSCADFSLNGYLPNTSLYRYERNDFFDQSEQELERFFQPHKEGAERAGIAISQIHMPYPNYIPQAPQEFNEYLCRTVASKSMGICSFLGSRYIVIHGLKLAHYLGSEEAEWAYTERFLDTLAPMAREMGLTMCVENIYTSVAGHIVEGPCCDAKKAAERIDRFNDRHHAEVLGFCFDTGHANLIGIDFEKFLTELGFRLKVLHIHDNDGIADLHQVPFTFTKTRENTASTDWNGFIRGLRGIGFDKALSFETAPVLTAFPRELKLQALSLIAEIGRYFAGEICKNSIDK